MSAGVIVNAGEGSAARRPGRILKPRSVPSIARWSRRVTAGIDTFVTGRQDDARMIRCGSQEIEQFPIHGHTASERLGRTCPVYRIGSVEGIRIAPDTEIGIMCDQGIGGQTVNL